MAICPLTGAIEIATATTRMTTGHPDFELPPIRSTADGRERRVGYELEFSGLSLEDTARVVQRALDARVARETAAEREFEVDGLGPFTVELDWSYLKRKAEQDGASDSEWLARLGEAAALVVPVEIVCPPIPISDLGVLEPLVEGLRSAGAVGTSESWIAAYGVHINPEAPDLDASTVFDYVRAFALLQWWLVDAHAVDPTRRMSPYVDLYPQAYVGQLVSRDNVTIDDVFDDYLEYNASRNRALDLLPLLAEIDASRVRSRIDDPRIKPRPAFHYRLPNCHIERPDWRLSDSWNRWCVVERLAARADELDALAGRFRDSDRPLLGVSRGDWVEFVGAWLEDRGLV